MSTWIDPVPVMSRRMVIFLNILLVAIPVIQLILWSLSGTHLFTVVSNLLVSMGYHPLEIVTLGSKIFLSKTSQLMPMLMGLFVLKLIFTNYQKEIIFVEQNARYYRWIGWLLLIDNMLAKPLSYLLLSSAAGSHFGIIIIEAGFSITENFVAVLVLVISQVMLEGSRLREENQLTV